MTLMIGVGEHDVVERVMYDTILLGLLVLWALVSVPTWPYRGRWRYYSSSLLGVIITIVLILALLGRI